VFDTALLSLKEKWDEIERKVFSYYKVHKPAFHQAQG